MITKKNPNPKLKLSVSCTSNGSMCILYKPENTPEAVHIRKLRFGVIYNASL